MERPIAPGNLPAPTTTFIGRAQAIAEIKRLLPTARLLTLTGPGGCGKSRLAVRIATELTPTFPDGVVWVELAALTEPTLAAQVVAHTLGIPDQSGVAPLDAICDVLRTRRLLLILDNCEHLIDTAARVVEAILVTCPGVRLLATSREALNIDGETAWVVSPLSLPTHPDASVDAIEQSDAVRLFLDRAAAVVPSFALTPANVEAVTQICMRLDGIPLAIELAAARVKVLTPDDIAARLHDCFRLLTVGRRTALPRHQTLQAAVDWSHDLLTEPERVLFRRLSVLAGGFTLETAEAICASAGIAAVDVLDLLARLVDKSLVVVVEREAETRYRLLEPLRQYAADRLITAGEERAIARRYRDWFVALAERSANLEDAAQAAWLARFDAEYDNLRAVLRAAVEEHAPDTIIRIGDALWMYWLIRGYLNEGRQWLESALAELSEPTTGQARALRAAGVLTFYLGEYDRAAQLLSRSLAMGIALDASTVIGEAHYALGTVAQARGDYGRSSEEYERSLPHFRAANATRGLGLALNGLGLMCLYRGERERAVALCEEGSGCFRDIGDTRSLAGALTNLGIIAMDQGDYERATRLCEEGLTLRRRLGDRGGLAHTETILGRIAMETGDRTGAVAHYRAALALRQQTGETEGMLAPIEGLAAVASAEGDPTRAARLLGAAAALRTRVGSPLPPIDRALYDRTLAVARSQLSPSAFRVAWVNGEILPLARVIAEGMNGTDEDTRHLQTAEPAMQTGDTPTAQVQIFGFGTSRVLRAGRDLGAADGIYAKARELLFYVLMHGPSTKEQIGLALWPNASAAQLRTTFHPTLHHLRRALGGPEWIVLAQQRYDLNRALPYTFDGEQFTAAIAEAQRRAEAEPEAAICLLDGAVTRYGGKFLADAAEGEWFLPIQDKLQQSFLDALLLLGGLRFAAGAYTDAATVFRRVIAEDSYQESAHRDLMRCYARLGERSLALRQFQTFADMLRDELGATPALKTRALFERLRRGEEIE